MAEPGIEQATSCSQVRNATDWAMGLGRRYKEMLGFQIMVWTYRWTERQTNIQMDNGKQDAP